MAKQKISTSKNWVGSPDFDTYIPSLNDAANIEDAFKLFLYGTVDNGIAYDSQDSLYHHLSKFRADIDTVQNTAAGHASSSSNVHNLGTAGPGLTSGGNVVGTSAEQTLTNKTLTNPIISGNLIGTGIVSSTNILDGTISNIDISASASISDTKLDTISTSGKVSNSATTATSSNTANSIVARDSSGNFSAGIITASGNIIGHVDINNQSSSYPLVLSDDGKIIQISNASNNNVTFPLNSSVAFPIGTQITIVQSGSGQTTIAKADPSIVFNSTPGLKLRAQWSVATAIKTGTDTWLITGDLTA